MVRNWVPLNEVLKGFCKGSVVGFYNRGALIVRNRVPLKGVLKGFYKGSMVGFSNRGALIVKVGFLSRGL